MHDAWLGPAWSCRPEHGVSQKLLLEIVVVNDCLMFLQGKRLQHVHWQFHSGNHVRHPATCVIQEGHAATMFNISGMLQVKHAIIQGDRFRAPRFQSNANLGHAATMIVFILERSVVTS